MLGKLADRNQCEIFRTRLADLINPQHELALLADKIDWTYFENEFKHPKRAKQAKKAQKNDLKRSLTNSYGN